MNSEQFNVISSLIRSREPVRSTSRLVLVEGRSIRDVASGQEVSHQSVFNSVRRFKAAERLILTAFSPLSRQAPVTSTPASKKPSQRLARSTAELGDTEIGCANKVRQLIGGEAFAAPAAPAVPR